ncbi:hypothetical protein SAMN05428995_101320 [Loktanella sp. DSM 29012]|uniref:hypothetical protein n=1 Tax=Loktanella sp. DSM 29012 TaxID=1881056 RepID=UPI0008C62183|nr:hypothetical protein [Loktanella sp. DSM 29012]SEP62512.1 hypothetical protein SAMN05428995_101320 [Loktanella sp. DSM 29012]
MQKDVTPWLFAAAFAVSVAVAPSAAQAQDVEQSFAVALVRDALTAVAQANATGNYTVLRDYGSAQFRSENDATDLAMAFARLRSERLNLLQALVVDPVLQRATSALNNSAMRLTGYIPVDDRAISFDMEFVKEGGTWRIFALRVGEYTAPAAQD